MTLDEAIKHSEEVTEEQEKLYRLCPASESEMLHCDGIKDCKTLKDGKNKGCLKCAEDHRQLADWLKELKQLREQESKTGRWIATDEGFSLYECSRCGSVEFRERSYCLPLWNKDGGRG